MESEKAKKIKKVLEQNTNTCLSYDFEKNTEFKIFQCQYILDYINELESENERLRNAKVVHETVDYCYEDLKKAENRISELEKENKENNSYAKGYADGIKNTYEVVVPDKLKQFAERLKEKAIRRQEFIGELAIDDVEYVKVKDIDKTLKEFIK